MTKSIDELIEASSLGTPHAKAMRASVPDEVAQQVVRRSEALGRFLQCGFTEDQAWAMARADMDVLGVVPLGWSSRPFDQQLAHVERAI